MPKIIKDKGISRRRHNLDWNTRFNQLVLFKEENGHCRVPRKHQLGIWVMNQRAIYNKKKEGKLSPEQISRLNGIEFKWELQKKGNQVSWDARFDQLVEYKEKNGNCNVSTLDEDNLKFANWVKWQRQLYKKGKLSPEQIESMNGIGFEWELQSWDARFKQLEEYKEEHGHCDVSHNNKELGSWVNRQRIANKKNKLSPEQKERLEGIGFELECRKQVGWDGRFEQLKEYKKDHGDCNVSRNYKANPQLATWVLKQRQLRKKGKLLKERIESLQGIGFSWAGEVSRGRRMKKSEAVDIVG